MVCTWYNDIINPMVGVGVGISLLLYNTPPTVFCSSLMTIVSFLSPTYREKYPSLMQLCYQAMNL
jgi:hypothetical protein